MTGRVVGVQVAAEGGVPKLPVESAEVTETGVFGDRQLDLEYHGGPTRAVCLYAQECIDALAAEGHPIARGTTGENVTVAGIEWSSVRTGDLIIIDSVVLEITGPAPPCTTIAASFLDGKFSRISDKTNPGWSRMYARVVVPGRVREGAPVRHEPPEPAVV
jgi:MOSC domain-containing protein YiiM